jgi:hypothetical protein
MNKNLPEKFFLETTQEFNFLESEFGYKLVSKDVENIDDPQDAKAFVRYLSSKVGIEIYWYFASAAIGIALVEITKANEFPGRRRFWGKMSDEARAIKLHTLAKMQGKENSFVLKELRSTKPVHIKKREKVIGENLGSVLENLSQILKNIAQNILLGDTSIFPKVQKYEEELLRKEYPALY